LKFTSPIPARNPWGYPGIPRINLGSSREAAALREALGHSRFFKHYVGRRTIICSLAAIATELCRLHDMTFR
jgi:hypothetical protein